MKRKAKRNQKIRLSGLPCALACAAALICFGHTVVWAGNINAEEQRIIDYYNQTFTYNGKNYIATEAAKAAAYNKLAADDVDLSKSQVDSLLLQAKNNIAAGIADGYLVEVAANTENAAAPGTEETESAGNSESAGETEKTSETAEQTKKNETTEKKEPSTEKKDDSTEKKESSTEKKEDSTEKEEASGVNTETESSQVQEVNWGTESTQAASEAGGKNDDTGQGGRLDQKHSENDMEENNGEDLLPIKIDISQFINDVINEGEGSISVNGQNGEKTGINAGMLKEALEKNDLLTVRQYASGKVTMLRSDGTVLYQSSLPIKNTGYMTGGIFLILSVIAAGLGILSAVVYRFRHKKNIWAFLPAAFTMIAGLAAGAGGTGAWKAEMADYTAVWIVGAPQYDYSQEAWAYVDKGETKIRKPFTGTRYGQITCEKLQLQAPLYYGDDDEWLELGAGTYSGGALPGENGTCLIGAHDTTYFAPLEHIAAGDVLTIDTAYGNYQYQVTKTQNVNVTDWSASELKESGGGEKLILYTCYPFGAAETIRDQRFFVYAQRIGQTESGE